MMTIEKFFSDQSEDSIKWMNGHRLEWMTDDQWFCCLFLNRVFRGFHHVPGTPKENGRGIEMNSRTWYMATCDFDYLTKMVIMSHNWGVRVALMGSGPGMIKFTLHRRHKREGQIGERIETIQDMVEKYRDY